MHNFSVLFLLGGLFSLLYRFALADSCTIWPNEYLNRFETCTELCTTITRLSSFSLMLRRCCLHYQNSAIYLRPGGKFSPNISMLFALGGRASQPAHVSNTRAHSRPFSLNPWIDLKKSWILVARNRNHTVNILFMLCIHCIKSFGFFSAGTGYRYTIRFSLLASEIRVWWQHLLYVCLTTIRTVKLSVSYSYSYLLLFLFLSLLNFCRTLHFSFRSPTANKKVNKNQPKALQLGNGCWEKRACKF